MVAYKLENAIAVLQDYAAVGDENIAQAGAVHEYVDKPAAHDVKRLLVLQLERFLYPDEKVC